MRALAGVLALLGLALVSVPGEPRASPQPPAVVLRPKVLRTFPHDPHAFTQGLVLDRGRLYESTGLYGRSSVREVQLRTGRVLRVRKLADPLFGEGLALVGSRLVQLTWQENVAPVWARASFRRLGTFRYAGEGWGLCFDGRRLVQSDGSGRLTFRDPGSFRATGGLLVTVRGSAAARVGLRPGPVTGLNELECVGRFVYANVYPTDLIVRIDAASGVVGAVIDAAGLLPPGAEGKADVLNGIAHDSARRTFLLTGKLWPRLFEVRFVAG